MTLTIQWGSWSNNDRLRAGIELTMSPSTVTSSTTSVTITAKVYLQTRYASSESGSGTTWSVSSAVTASGSTDWSLGAMGTQLMGTASQSYATSYSSSSALQATGRVFSNIAYPGTEAAATAYLTIPKRPVSVPAAPSSVSASRVSDTQHTISWTRNATTDAPYSSLGVERWDNVSGVYSLRATLSGAATSWSDTGTIADREYRWRVYASNDAGVSSRAFSGNLKTTPKASGTPTATKTSSGDITVAWSGNSAIADGIEVWHASGGVWDGAALATLSGTATTYSHTSPSSSAAHSYRTRAKTTTPALTGAYSATSNTVALLAAPNAPTNLSPNGSVRDAALPVTLTWQHNPVDTTAQTKYEVQYRTNGGAWTSTGTVTSSTTSRTITAGTWANGSTIEWQVRTWGGHADPSPWSATASFTTSATPTAAPNSPDASTPHTSSTVSASWGYYQSDGLVQAAWQARLKDGAGAVLETRSGSGAATSTTFTRSVADATTYKWDVRVQSSAGLWSDWAEATFAVAYATPPAPILSLLWMPDTGAVAATVDVAAPGAGEVAAVSVSLWRESVAGWVLVAADVAPGSSVTDYIPPLGALVAYKATAYSATPSAIDSAVTQIMTDGAQHAFVNGGAGFSQLVRLLANVVVSVEDGLADKTLHQFAGRTRPVEFAGEATSLVLGVAADLFGPMVSPALDQSTLTEVRDLARVPGPHCFRSPDGERYFVSMSRANGQIGSASVRPLAFTLTETDWHEPTEESL